MSAILGRMATYSGKLITMEEALAKGASLVPDESALAFDKKPPVMPDENGFYPIPVPGTYNPFTT
jgi:myo-inositol 2-dehydrogenase / D-chiro-inositol 1-dehydrogenase